MGVKWTATRDQNLLLLIIQDIKVDFSLLADKWQKQFPDEDFHPTAKAVSEHVAALKRKMGGSSGQSVAAGPTPTNKNKTKAPNGNPKTPSSKPKRSRAEMADEDDSEEEKMTDFDTPVPKRTTPSRHRTPKKYKDEDSETENDDVIIMSSTKSTKTEDAVHTAHDLNSPRPSIARSKSNPPKLNYFEDSDVAAEEDTSDFEPLT